MADRCLFQKFADRSQDSLRAIVAVFNTDDAYVTGIAENVKLNLTDEVLASKDPAATLHWDFEVEPGRYVVRLILREMETKAMTALNRSAIIPL